ncbi:hypothetical protein [Burkholderia sp. A1]|uniref:hypothetical protein n=1 Tax=Burkholderia sp. A1 TaxID=148446 RepID=UPI000A942A37
MAMLTVNADDHEVMKHMHRPDDEKRSVVILRPEDHDEWLHGMHFNFLRTLFQQWPADDMISIACDG